MKTLVEVGQDMPVHTKTAHDNKTVDLASILGLDNGSGDVASSARSGLLGKVALESTESVFSQKFSQPKLHSAKPEERTLTTLRPPATGTAGMTGTSTEMEALKQVFADVQQPSVGPALISESESESFKMSGGGDDMPDTGDLDQHFPTKPPLSMEMPTETSDYSSKNAMMFNADAESRGFDLQPVEGTTEPRPGLRKSADSSSEQLDTSNDLVYDRHARHPARNTSPSGAPFVLKSILKTPKQNVQPQSGKSPESKKPTRTSGTPTKKPKRQSSKSPARKSTEKPKAAPRQSLYTKQTADQGPVRHSSPIKDSVPHKKAPPRGQARSKGRGRSPGEELIERSQDLVNVVESFSTYIRGFNDISPIRQNKPEPPLQQQRKQIHDSNAEFMLDQMKEEMRLKEIEHRRKEDAARREFEAKLQDLRQENFSLNAQISALNSDPPSHRAKLPERPKNLPENVTEEDWISLKDQLEQQENLIDGYQKENERLYEELKSKRAAAKPTEAAMFKENQKLLKEIGQLRDTLDERDVEIRKLRTIQANLDYPTSPAPSKSQDNRISDLQSQLAEYQRENIDLERRLEKATNERALAHKTSSINHSPVAESQSDRRVLSEPERIQPLTSEIEEKYRRELLQKGDYISTLKSRVQQSETELAQLKLKSKDDEERYGRQVQDLQRQLKELESSSRKKDHESVSTLINGRPSKSPSRVDAVVKKQLEDKVFRLENELTNREDTAKKSMQELEQKFAAIKVQYELRVSELESELKVCRSQLESDGGRPHSSVTALERELAGVKERLGQKVTDLQAQVKHLQHQLETANAKGKSATSRSGVSQREKNRLENVEVRLKATTSELELKNREIANLRLQLNKLNNQPRGILKTSKLSNGPKPREKPADPERASRDRPLDAQPTNQMKLAEFTDDQPTRDYNPTHFAANTLNATIHENAQLRQKVEELERLKDTKVEHLQQQLADSEARLKSAEASLSNEMAALQRAHEQQIQSIVLQHANDYSKSKVAEMHSKISTQEILVKHLRQQLLASQGTESELATALEKSAKLEEQVVKLLAELQASKRHHTPAMSHYEKLEQKLDNLQRKYDQREQELKSLVLHNQQLDSDDAAKENSRLRHIITQKNAEISQFKTELDSMLQMLQALKNQGVIVPINGILQKSI